MPLTESLNTIELTNWKVCESSRFATELGAAIHIPPNAGGLLKRMGFSTSAIGANPCLRVSHSQRVSNNL